MHHTQRIPLATAAMSSFPYTPALEAAYSFVDKYDAPVCAAVRDGGLLWVPRETCPVGKMDLRVAHPPLTAINCSKPPRDKEQGELIVRSLLLLREGKNHIFEAPTGFGKTYCGTAIANQLGQPTLIVVTKNDLVKQWQNTLINLIGVDPKLIGIVQQDKCQYEGKRYVIGMVHSLIKPDRYPKDFYNWPGLVLFDETHRMGADTFVEACRLFPARYRLGMSATPRRSDGRDGLFKAHIGPVMVVGKTVPMPAKILVRKTGFVLPPKWIKGPHGWSRGKAAPTPGRMMKEFLEMGKDPVRNHKIVEFAVAAYKKGRTTVIMSDLIDGHLRILFHDLVKHIPANMIGYYISGMKQHEIDHTVEKARIILATYGMTAEGTDMPHWDTLVFGTPRANVTQPLGRITRSMEGKLEPVALDLVDADPIFYGFLAARRKQYYAIPGTKVIDL